MTNFEKWKQGLTPEGASVIVACWACPNTACEAHEDPDMYSGREECLKNYLAWANAGAEEETK